MFTSHLITASCLDHREPLPSAPSVRTLLGGKLAYPPPPPPPPPTCARSAATDGVRARPHGAAPSAPTDRHTCPGRAARGQAHMTSELGRGPQIADKKNKIS